MPRPRKQLLLKLGVFLLLGVVVNVAVAWGCVFIAPRLSSVTKPNERQTTDLQSQHHVGWGIMTRQSALTAGFGAGGAAFTEGDALLRSFGYEELKIGAHCWIRRESFIIYSTLAGWPAKSVSNSLLRNSHAESTNAGQMQFSNDYFNRAVGTLTPTIGVRVPTSPLWLGFAINTIFYAALLWVLFFVPGKIRRLVRIRRGCCPACGYRIAEGVGPVCSECGAKLPKSLLTSRLASPRRIK
jgi:hypothetical protein